MSKRPGKILKEFDINFTNSMFYNKSEHIKYDDEYFSIKDEILDIINNQIED